MKNGAMALFVIESNEGLFAHRRLTMYPYPYHPVDIIMHGRWAHFHALTISMTSSTYKETKIT